MVIQDLKTVCGTREGDPRLARPALVAVDEFSGLAGDQIAGGMPPSWRSRAAALKSLAAAMSGPPLKRSAPRPPARRSLPGPPGRR
jgi:hypothetical protein